MLLNIFFPYQIDKLCCTVISIDDPEMVNCYGKMKEMKRCIVADTTEQTVLQAREKQTDKIQVNKSYSFTQLSTRKIKTDTNLTFTTDSEMTEIESLTGVSTIVQQHNKSIKDIISGIEIQHKQTLL